MGSVCARIFPLLNYMSLFGNLTELGIAFKVFWGKKQYVYFIVGIIIQFNKSCCFGQTNVASPMNM